MHIFDSSWNYKSERALSDNAQYAFDFKITKFVIVEANPLERQLMFFTIFPVIHNVALLTIYFFFPCLSMFKKDNNSVLDNYACSKVAFLHPLKKQFRKNPYITRNRPLSRGYIATFVFCVFHDKGSCKDVKQLSIIWCIWSFRYMLLRRVQKCHLGLA